MRITLPWPPSVNHYWAPAKQGGMRIGPRGKAYRAAVVAALADQGHWLIVFAGQRGPLYAARLRVLVLAYPPDRIRRDIDNLGKAALDALESAGIYQDDSQIDDLHIIRRQVDPPGRLEITIEAA